MSSVGRCPRSRPAGACTRASGLVRDPPVAQVSQHRLGALARGDQPHVPGGRGQRAFERVLVVVTLRRHDDVRAFVDRGGIEVERGQHAVDTLADRGIAAVVDRDRPPAQPGGQRRERLRGGRTSDRDELRLWQDRFHVDLQCPFALARDRHGDDAVAPVQVEFVGRAQEQQPGRALLDGLQRLAHHGGFGTRAADPPAHGPIGRDQGGGALLARGRRAPPHDGGQHVRLALRRQVGREPDQCRLHAEPAPAFERGATVGLRPPFMSPPHPPPSPSGSRPRPWPR